MGLLVCVVVVNLCCEFLNMGFDLFCVDLYGVVVGRKVYMGCRLIDCVCFWLVWWVS